MIKFTDVCKAYVRYWYVILICIAIVFGLVFGLTSCKDEYTAKSTLMVDKNDSVKPDEFISQAYAENEIRVVSMLINHTDFLRGVLNRIGEVNPPLKEKLTIVDLKRNLNVVHKKDSTFFELTYTADDGIDAKVIVDMASEHAIAEYGLRDGKAKLTKVYSTEIEVTHGNRGVYAVIGVLIGLVVGIVLVTFFVVFNPFVENSDLLEKESGLPILATLDKKRCVKNEN